MQQTPALGPMAIAGQSCANPPSYSQYQQQLSPERQEQFHLEQQERQVAYKARFASTLRNSQSHGIGSQSNLVLANQHQKRLVSAWCEPESRHASLAANAQAPVPGLLLFGNLAVERNVLASGALLGIV